MANEKRNIEIYRDLFKNRKLIAWFTLIMTISAVVFTMPFFIPPQFKAEAVISPSGTNSAKMFIERDPKFGGDREIDEQTQILQSGMVRDSMIKRFNLAQRYEIDTSESTGRYHLLETYDESIIVDRTRYNAISVTVYDINPDTAALMANTLIEFGDRVKNAIINNNQKSVFKSVEKEYLEMAITLDMFAKVLNEANNKTLVSGSLIRAKNNSDQLKEQIDLKTEIQKLQTTGQSIDKLLMLQDYDKQLQQFLELQTSYAQAVVNSKSKVPPSYVISPAEPIDKKAYPKRTLIVLIVAAASFFISAAVVVFSKRVSEFFISIKTIN